MVPLCLHAVANTPAGLMEFVRSYDSITFGLPTNRDGSAPALRFSRPAQRSLTLRPACSPGRLRDPLHQRLQRSRCLHRCSDCYRVERTSSRAGIPPLWTSAFTAHPVCSFEHSRWRGGRFACYLMSGLPTVRDRPHVKRTAMNSRKIVIGAVLVLIGLPIVLLLIVFVAFYAVFYFPNRTIATTGTIVSSGEKREYLLYVSKSYDPVVTALFLLPLNLKPSEDADAAITQTAMISRI